MTASRLLLILGLLVAPLPAEAQPPQRIPRIGYLAASSAASDASSLEAFRHGLRELGYVERERIVVETRSTEGKADRLPEVAAELVGLKVDIIVTSGVQAALAAKNATKTIPIVMASGGLDPVEAGLVESLARPGGNITGLTNQGGDIGGKRLELLKDVVRKTSRVAILYEGGNPGSLREVKDAETAARPLGLTALSWEVRRERPDGLFVGGGPFMDANGKRIAEFASKSRLPSVFIWRQGVADGGLMSCGRGGRVASGDGGHRIESYLGKSGRASNFPLQRTACSRCSHAGR